MSVVSFWSQDKKETCKTSAVIALATYMAIEHNYRILVVSTSVNDDTITIRARDTMEQITLNVDELVSYIEDKIKF